MTEVYDTVPAVYPRSKASAPPRTLETEKRTSNLKYEGAENVSPQCCVFLSASLLLALIVSTASMATYRLARSNRFAADINDTQWRQPFHCHPRCPATSDECSAWHCVRPIVDGQPANKPECIRTLRGTNMQCINGGRAASLSPTPSPTIFTCPVPTLPLPPADARPDECLVQFDLFDSHPISGLDNYELVVYAGSVERAYTLPINDECSLGTQRSFVTLHGGELLTFALRCTDPHPLACPYACEIGIDVKDLHAPSYAQNLLFLNASFSPFTCDERSADNAVLAHMFCVNSSVNAYIQILAL